MILRASRAVSSMQEQVFDEKYVQEIEERTCRRRAGPVCYTGMMMSLRLREARQLRRQRHANRFHTVTGNAKNIPHTSPVQELVPTLCVSSAVSTQHRRRTPSEDWVEVATVAVDCCLRNTPGEDSIPSVGHDKSRNLSTVSSRCCHEGSCDRLDWTASCS